MVKIKNLLFILLFFNLSFLNAQEFKGGLIGGFTASQIDGDRNGGYHKFGLTGGAFVTRTLFKPVNYKFELRFTQKGMSNTNKTYRQRLNYVEVPLSCEYLYKKIGFEAGFSFAVLMNAVYIQHSFTKEYDFAKYDFPALAGINYHFSKKLCLNFRMTYSTFRIRGFYNNACLFSLYYYLKN